MAPQLGDPQVDPQFGQVLNLWHQHLAAHFPMLLVHVLLDVVTHDGLLSDGLPRLHVGLLDVAGVHGVAAFDADGRHLCVPFPEFCHVFGHSRSSVGVHFLPKCLVEMLVEFPVDGVPLESSGPQLRGQFGHGGSFTGVELEEEQVFHLPTESLLEQDERFLKILHQHDQVEMLCDELDALFHPWVIHFQSVVLPKVKEQQVFEVEGVETLRVKVVLGLTKEFIQLVITWNLPGKRHHSAKVVEGRFKELGGLSQDCDVRGVCGEQLGHLRRVEAHVITDDVEAHPRPVVFDLGALEKRRIEKVVSAAGEGKLEPMLLSKTEEEVEEGAAGCLVGLQEHDVHFRRAALAWSFLRAVGGGFALHLGRTVGARVGHRNPARGRGKQRGERRVGGCSDTLQKVDVHVSLWKADVGLHGVEAVEQDHAAGQEGAQEQALAHGPPRPRWSARHGPEGELDLTQQKEASAIRIKSTKL